MKGRTRPILVLCAALVGGAALFAEPVLVRDLRVGEGPYRMTVGAIRVPLWSAAFAQGAGDFTLENVTVALETATHRFRTIRFSGVTSSRAEIDALFDGSAKEPLSVRLSRINAREIVIPEIATEIKLPHSQRFAYRDVVLKDVVAGVVKTATSASTAVEATEGGKRMTATYGRMTAEDTDLPLLVRSYAEGGGNPADPPKTAQRSFTGENIVVSSDDGFSMKVARVAGRDFAIRPTKAPFFDVLATAQSLDGKDKPSEEEALRVLASSLEILDSFRFGLAEMTGIEFSAPAAGDPVNARIARIAFMGRTADKPADLRVEGLDVTVKEGSAKVDLYSMTGFSFENTFATLRSVKDNPAALSEPATVRALIPTLGTIRYSGMAFDVRNEDAKGGPKRVQFGMKDLVLTAEKPVNGIPTNVRYSVAGFVMPVPADTSDDYVKDLLAMGYRTIDASWSLAATWNEAAKEIALSDVSVSGVDMGRVSLTGTVGGVARDVFDPDTTTALVSLLGATAKGVTLTVENGGLFERLLAAQAKKRNKSADALRREYAAAAAVAIPAVLGNSEQSKAIGQAVAKFVAKPGRLRITAKAKDPAGLGIADVMGAPEPAAVLRKLDVTAVAEEKI